MPIALLLAAVVPQPEALKTFGDWIVGCDNHRACQAVALVPEDWPEDALTMSVRRGAEAEAAPAIAFALGEDAAAAALAADGVTLKLRLISSEDLVAVDPRDAAAAVQMLRSANSLRLLTSDGKSLGTISLKGASAALLYMDDRQQRVGTVTALVRPGAKPAAAVPAPPALPRIVAASPSSKPARAMAKAEADRLRQESCDIEIEADEEGEVEVFRLDDRTTLALVPVRCWSGAYNMASRTLAAGDDGPWQGARFDLPLGQGAEDTDSDIVSNVSWDPKTRRLSSYMKGRGLGDCGTAQDHVWDGERFRLVEQAEMGECRGSVDYITTWRAEAVRP